MKIRKWLVSAGLVLAAGALLAGCGGSKSSSTNTYSYVYGVDPYSLDYVFTNSQQTSDVVTNLIDGLLENDKYGNLIPSLAEDWTVSKDGLTYTYKLRKDAKWFTADGEEYAGVKAQDFVTGLKHAVDSKSEALYLIEDSVKGLKDYEEGKIKDFSEVGVKAVDDYTVEYTLNQPEPFWNSKTTSTVLFPINAEFLESKGKNFGSVDPSSILYNGPYLLKSLTAKSSIEYQKNPNYYDKDNVHVETIKLTYFDGADQEGLIRNFKDGNYTVAALFPTSSSFPEIEKEFKDYITYYAQSAESYYYQLNLDRKSYKYSSKKTDAEKTSAQEAALNKNFRQALTFSINRHAFAAQVNGENAAQKILRNTLVPPTFVQVGDKSYGQVLQDKLVNYGTTWANINLADGQDGYYNTDKAKEVFAKAKEELTAKGVTFPIHIDIPVQQSSKQLVAQASSVKQSVESSLGAENVVIDLQMLSDDDYNNAALLATTAAQKDFDLNMAGWIPDYQDPSTYLDAFNINNGFMVRNIGFEPGEVTDKVKEVGLDTYTQMLAEAAKIQDEVTRFEKYAEAEAFLLDSAVIMPVQSTGGTPFVTRNVPYTRAYSPVGVKGAGSFFKYLKVQEEPVKDKDYQELAKEYRKERTESNEQAQKDLEKHIK